MMDGKFQRVLGVASIGIGAAELFAPRWIDRKLGAKDHPIFTRVLGVRDVVSGVGTIARPENPIWSFARVAGDIARVAALGAALETSRKRALVLGALGVIAAIGVLDALSARARL
jgi:hypothetical protein